MRAVIVTGPDNYDIDLIPEFDKDDFIIGADIGAFKLSDKKIVFNLALGDFDSVTTSQLEVIRKYAKEVKEYPEVKDYTDTHLAVKIAQEKGYDEILIIGGIGNRIDHTLASVNLLKLGNITLINNETKMYLLNPGIYNIENTYKYISFFAVETANNLTLNGFKYELLDYHLDQNDPLCVSNQGQGIVKFTSGKLLVIHQNE